LSEEQIKDLADFLMKKGKHRTYTIGITREELEDWIREWFHSPIKQTEMINDE